MKRTDLVVGQDYLESRDPHPTSGTRVRVIDNDAWNRPDTWSQITGEVAWEGRTHKIPGRRVKGGQSVVVVELDHDGKPKDAPPKLVPILRIRATWEEGKAAMDERARQRREELEASDARVAAAARRLDILHTRGEALGLPGFTRQTSSSYEHLGGLTRTGMGVIISEAALTRLLELAEAEH